MDVERAREPEKESQRIPSIRVYDPYPRTLKHTNTETHKHTHKHERTMERRTHKEATNRETNTQRQPG